ncbi:MAG: VWA domain-containing protein [Flavobacteriales bacterium]|nr:VWA domain-containing protein [Flavobacteriales bacterium]
MRVSLLAPLLFAAATLAAQTPGKPLTRMLFVFDASNSMNAFWGDKPKINTARELLLRSLGELQGRTDIELALRLYGHQTPIEPGKQDCNDTRLEVPFGGDAIPAMRKVLEGVRCVGTTPIARSLEKAGGDFPEGKGVRNIIILITDGIEACDEDPCAVSRALQAKGIVLKPFVIGVGIEEGQQYSLRCVGNYYDASSPELFAHVLDVVVAQALNTTTCQVDLLTSAGKPLETDVAMTFTDQRTGQVQHQFEHTLNERGVPDTLTIDPVLTYRLVVHTIPPVVQEHVKLTPGTHTVIKVPAGQGQLELKLGTGMADPYGVLCLVRKAGEAATLHVQRVNSTDRYLVGIYDLEVLTLPRMLVPGVRIEQGATNTVHIPQEGVLNVQAGAPGHGALFVVRGSEREWVADLDPRDAQDQFRLLPGSYEVVYRSANARRTEYSILRPVTVESGRSVTLTF